MFTNQYNKILEIVISVIYDYSLELGKEKIISKETRLIGSNSDFDSSDLVQIIVEIEEKINNSFNSQIVLTDEKAMSRTTSPFVSIETLVQFINESLNER